MPYTSVTSSATFDVGDPCVFPSRFSSDLSRHSPHTMGQVSLTIQISTPILSACTIVRASKRPASWIMSRSITTDLIHPSTLWVSFPKDRIFPRTLTQRMLFPGCSLRRYFLSWTSLNLISHGLWRTIIRCRTLRTSERSIVSERIRGNTGQSFTYVQESD